MREEYAFERRARAGNQHLQRAFPMWNSMFVHVTVRASACWANTVEDSEMVDKNETEMLLRPILVSGCDPDC